MDPDHRWIGRRWHQNECSLFEYGNQGGIYFTWPRANTSDNLLNLKCLHERTALKGRESNQEYMLIAGYNRVTTLHIKFVMGY